MTDAQKPVDQAGIELAPGDTVEIVFGGEHHTLLIEAISLPFGPGTVPHLTGPISITLPAPAAHLVKKAPKPEAVSAATDERRPVAPSPAAPAPTEAPEKPHTVHKKPTTTHKKGDHPA